MRHLAEVLREPLTWAQPHMFERVFELRAGSEMVARLSFGGRFGSEARAATADGTWTFRRIGFWQTRATARTAGASGDLAMFEPNTWKGGGTLRLTHGPAVVVSSNMWQSTFDFRLSDGTQLFRIRTDGMLRKSATIDIAPAMDPFTAVPCLLLFGWYLVVMMHQDAASVVIVA